MVSVPDSLQPDSETVADSREEVGSRVCGSLSSVEILALASLMARYPQAVLSKGRLSVSVRGEGLLQELWPGQQFGLDPNTGETGSPK